MSLRTQPGKQSLRFEAALQLPWSMTNHDERYNSTRSKGREGKWLPGNLNLAN